jgi:hypothetical protein
MLRVPADYGATGDGHAEVCDSVILVVLASQNNKVGMGTYRVRPAKG